MLSSSIRCERCGEAYIPTGPREKYCVLCLQDSVPQDADPGDQPTGFTDPPSEELTWANPADLKTGFGLADEPSIRSAGGTLGDGARIGQYRVERLIGEGGMGAVYQAEQEHPRRTVALKVIKPGLASPELLRRFEQESQALGRLQHPGIAQIYEAGTADTGYGPQPYFAMEFIRGKTLREFAEERRLSARARLEIITKVCDAVHHAHQRGLIHRDLKPGNILVDETGQPKILDFGVARVTDGDSQATMQTDVGQLVGTLAYMSPEQVLADPLELDTRSDVYALGVILYELLAGRLPYTISKKLHEAMQAIREEDPARLSSINRNFRGDIETIVAKALEKDKTRRYSSAAELAADIAHHLRDEPIVARPPSTTYQLQKFARRHKALVAGVAAVFVVLVLGIVTSLWEASLARRAEKEAVEDRNRAQAAQQLATAAEKKATVSLDEAVAAQQVAETERSHAQTEQQRADAQRLLTVWQSLAREAVYELASRIDDDRAALLARQAMRIHSRTPNQPQYLVEDALQRAASLGSFNHDVFPGYTGSISVVAFSPDGSRLAFSGDDAVMVWDKRNAAARPLKLQLAETIPVSALAFSPDGERLATGDRKNNVRVWRLGGSGPATSELLPSPASVIGRAEGIRALAFSPDGKRLASGANDNAVRVWDLSGARPAPLPQLPSGLQGPVHAVVFSPDSTKLAAGGEDRNVLIWDLSGRAALMPQLPGGALGPAINTVVFSPDGARLAAGSDDKTVRVWNLGTPASVLASLTGASDSISALAFSKDSVRLAVASRDQSVQIWNLRARPALTSIQSALGKTSAAAFSSDLNYVATGSENQGVRVWDLRKPDTTILQLQGDQGSSTAVVLSRDGWLLASPGSGGTIQVWDLHNAGAPPVKLPPQAGVVSVQSLAFSSDGERLASGGYDGLPRVWNWRNQVETPVTLAGSASSIVQSLKSLAFSADGSALAAGGSLDGSINVWDLRQPGKAPDTLRGPRGSVNATAFSPDGKRLATATAGQVLMWDWRNSKAVPSKLPSPAGVDEVQALMFSPDGRWFAATTVNEVELWDMRNAAAQPLRLRSPEDSVRSVAFSPDSWRLAAAGANAGTVRLWDLRKPDAGAVGLTGSQTTIDGIAFAPDGTSLKAFSGRGLNLRLWPLWSRAADDLCARASRNLTAEEWNSYIGEGIPYERTCPGLPAP